VDDGRSLLGHEFLDTNSHIRGTPELKCRVLLAAEATKEHMAGDTYTVPLIVINVPKLHIL
jgi:hypothetical protein